ncbi:exonuclease 1-like isoform X1 [Apium graveolens]|uniref:exonuclease 1-like isoform X1 n=1 Tax=Apium graveolens TaxID=4045 RepID=UPI003D7B35DF
MMILFFKSWHYSSTLCTSISQHTAKGIATGDLDPFTKLPFQQGKCVLTVSMLDGASQPKNTKLEGERKKIDLPVKKNLLTNYFCFASLEAKRKYQVPRVASKHAEMRSKVDIREDNNEAAFAYDIHCSRPAQASPGDPDDVDPTKDSVLNAIAAKSSVFSEFAHGTNEKEKDLRSLQSSFLQQPRDSSKYPCTVINKEGHQHKDSNAVMGKTRIEKKNVIVRSSYFQKKSMKGNGLGNKDGQPSYKDSDPTSRSLSTIQECEYRSALDGTEGETIFEKGHIKSDTVLGKMRVEQKNVIVRSPYFQKKSVKENGPENKDGKMFVKYSNPSARSVSTIQECQFKSTLDKSEGETIIEDRDPILQLPIKSVITDDHGNTNFTAPMHVCKSAEDEALCKTVAVAQSRKVVVRSPYFMHSVEKENDQEKGVAFSTYENTIHETGNKYCRGPNIKRKFDDDVQTEIPAREHLIARKCLRATESPPIRGTCTLDPEDAVETKNEQDKFGCDISHIDRYSDIAEKSIENFASIISSFKYTSGSRPSGLRAPLKDVRNTCTNSRSNEAADFSKFAYVPTKRKTFPSRSNEAADFSKFAYVPTKQKTFPSRSNEAADLSKFAYVPTKQKPFSVSRR